MVIFMTVGSLNPESLEKLNDVVRRGFDLFESVFKKMGYTRRYAGSWRTIFSRC